MHIRRYQDSDWSEVCTVHDAARPIEVDNFMPGAAVLALEDVAEEDEFFAGDCFVALMNNHIVGFMCIEPPELSWLYVSPNYHRRGVGQQLVEYVLPQLGPDAFLTTALENTGGVMFYQQMGFRISATFPGSCQAYPCTCVRLTLPGSMRENQPPVPVKESLVLAGYCESNPGRAVRDAQGIWRWV
ncbi:GNAT family N-acetyltransferase [filamentous cyanobacterium LEGE 11480]|uniref:GNAT family N-acetyltransferase n=1 Tax=Romeriopsis navalis LEGE 11480 TaxID=2777977 RepID=A0A928VMT8_9CYAN|nr:GNAT family N-acetyltransferase [Romeriopsis navalis]MBE9030507.1 GNAT family N-acetyltransferase [Romeriopsis navalis LEGE 11480]